MKPVITWIVLADGNNARFFLNEGPGKGLKPLPELDRSTDTLKAGDIMADRPGRSFSPSGQGRSAMEPPTDPVEKIEADFARDLADLLSEKIYAKAYQRLIIVAAPNSLGNIRKHLSAQVGEAVIAELPKNLINTPVNDLSGHLETVLAV